MNREKWTLVLFAVLINSVYSELELKIMNGKIKGQILKSRDGRPFYSYTGIPYAKPPIGELRFKAPEPAEQWNGTLDATKKPNACMNEQITDCNEDCLYLNVYSPKSDKNHLPIMVWIHGGGFFTGYSASSGPEYFMDKDVILVTINYRLGVLGFLSTEDDVIPGNYGMKDQVEALKWVQKNIIYFNGDPKQVTIFGVSAGGASAGFHMLSPMSKGLFHKVILQSGNPVCRWAILPSGVPRKRAHTVATIAGCNFNTSEDILNCLKKLPADYIVKVQSKLYAWLNHPAVLFNPVVENCDPDEHGAFLCNHPIYDFKQESFVPAIFGFNSAEGALFVSSLYNSTSLVHTELRDNFNRLLSIMLHYNHYTKEEYIDEIGQLVLKEYFPSGTIDDDSHFNAVHMISDETIIRCTLDMAKQMSSPVYGYYYDYQNDILFNQSLGLGIKPLGVNHGDELISLFKLKMSHWNQDNLNASDLEVSRVVVDIWYKFVSSETPTIDGSNNGVAWPTLSSNEKFTFLHINSAQPKIVQNPFGEKYKFWNRIGHYFHSRQTSPQKSSWIKNEL